MARLIAERADVIPPLGEIFREYGYEGASLKIISAKTGLGKGSLYHFFPGGKEEMASAALEEIVSWFEEHIYRNLENEAPDTAIRKMFLAVKDYFESGRRVCLVGAFALSDTRDRFSEQIEHYFRRWMTALEVCLMRKGHPEKTARQMSFQVISEIQGSIILTRALRDDQPFRIALEVLERKCMDLNKDDNL